MKWNVKLMIGSKQDKTSSKEQIKILNTIIVIKKSYSVVCTNSVISAKAFNILNEW